MLALKICQVIIFLLALTGCISAAIHIQSESENFKNIRVLRVVDLTKSVIKEDIAIRAKNTGPSETDVYYFILPGMYKPYIAFYEARLKQGTKDPLDMEMIGLDSTEQIFVYKIHLKNTVPLGEDVKIGIHLVYTHLTRPLPEKIPQVSKQHISFANNIYYFSVYATDDMKTTYNFPTTNIITYIGGEPNHAGQKSNNKIVYGIFNNIGPLAIGAGNFHYEYQSAILTVTSLKREMEISPWGANLAVEEHYALRHDGAKLDDAFNRVKYQLSTHVLDQTNVLTKLTFQLPNNSKDVYYRDEVGNVSTSNYREQDSVLEIQPRYPIFGGWKTTWCIGYNVPLNNFLKQYKGRYIFKVPFVENVKDMTMDDVHVKIILPEGAKDIKVTTPSTFSMDSVEHSTHYTYFDSTGRPTINFYKTNVVADHEQFILVSYKYSAINLLQKPLIVSTGLFLLCLISIFVSKLPYALGESAHKHTSVVLKKSKVSTDQFPKGTVLVDEAPVAPTRKKKKGLPMIPADATNTAVKDNSTSSRKKSNKK